MKQIFGYVTTYCCYKRRHKNDTERKGD